MDQEILPEFSQESKSLVIRGFYEHYRGLCYKVLSIARHSESLEEFVVYQAQYGNRDVWARPLHMFLENVTIDGVEKPRFRLLQTE